MEHDLRDNDLYYEIYEIDQIHSDTNHIFLSQP